MDTAQCLGLPGGLAGAGSSTRGLYSEDRSMTGYCFLGLIDF